MLSVDSEFRARTAQGHHWEESRQVLSTLGYGEALVTFRGHLESRLSPDTL